MTFSECNVTETSELIVKPFGYCVPDGHDSFTQPLSLYKNILKLLALVCWPPFSTPSPLPNICNSPMCPFINAVLRPSPLQDTELWWQRLREPSQFVKSINVAMPPNVRLCNWAYFLSP